MSDLTTTEAPAEITPAPAAPAASEAPVLTQQPAAPAPTPPAPPAAKPKAADKPSPDDKPDPVAHMLKALQVDNAKLDADLKAALKRAEAAEREAAKHAAERDTLTKRVAETAIVGRLRDHLPAGVPELDIRGALAALHEAGKIDRYAADPDAAAKAAHEALKAANSSLLRAAPPPGGPAGAPQQPPVRRHISAVG